MKLSLIAGIALVCHLAAAALTSQELLKLGQADKNRIVYVTDQNYKSILQGQRDYHLIMLMTSTSPTINCLLCNEFKPEFEIVSQSWFQDHPQGITEGDVEAAIQAIETGEKEAGVLPKDIFFLYSEFTNSKELFGVFLLNNIPKVFYLPPSTNSQPKAYLQESQEYQFYAGDHKDLLVQWLEGLTNQNLPIHIPPDYTRIVTNVVGAISIIGLGIVFSKRLGKVLSLRLLWSAFSLVAILLLTLGYMFNQIRGVPYLKEAGAGKLEYIMGGQQNQYGVETQIMSFVYGILSLCTVVLVKKAPEIKNQQVKLFVVLAFSGLIFFFYSLLVSIFRSKSQGYPFKLLTVL